MASSTKKIIGNTSEILSRETPPISDAIDAYTQNADVAFLLKDIIEKKNTEILK